MLTPSFTVIIPHRDSPDLLRRCLNSIPDTNHIQVIIVDDCSSPENVNLTHILGNERTHTQVLFNKNCYGAGHARNLALPHAKGKWLIFADADDYFTPTAWNRIDCYADSNADIVYLNILSVNSETGEILHDRGDLYITNLINYAQTNDKEWEYRLRFWNNTPWGKLIRHDLVATHQISFGETRHANDVLFSTRTAIKAQTINVCTDICYCVTHNSKSLTQDKSIDAIATRYEVCMQKNALLRAAGYYKYQQPILSYLREMLSFGLRGLMLFIRITCSYRGNILQSVYWSIQLRREYKR